MKIRKITILFLLFTLIVSLSSYILATEGEKANFNGASFKAVYTNNNVNFYSLEVSNITLPNRSNGKPVEMNVRYTIGNTKPEFSNIYGESFPGTYNAETKKLVFPGLETALQLKGDVHFWIFQLNDTAIGETKTGTLVYNSKIDRPAEKKYSELFGTPLIGSTITYITINTPMENYINRKAQFRIGEITDKSILTAIKNNDTANGFDKLLAYEKNSSSIYEGILEGKPNFAANLHDKLLGKIKNDTYYYIYTKFDDESGKYQPVEGITIGLGIAPTTQSCSLAFYGNSKFNWDNFTEEKPPKDPEDDDKKEQPSDKEPSKDNDKNDQTKNEDNTTVKKPLPQTGETTVMFVLFILLTVSAVVLYHKNKKYNFKK